MSVANGTSAGHVEAEGADLPRYLGKYPAVVVDNAPDGDAPHRGDILVAVPAIIEDAPPGGDSEDDEIGLETRDGRRAIQVLARPCFAPGAFFLPERGQHVWVEFTAGDVNEPIWTGMWLAEDAAPATSDDEAPTAAQRVVRSTSGHVIEFDDREDGERLIVRDHHGSTVVFDADGIHVDTEGDVVVRAANATVECEGDATLRAGNVTVDCDIMTVNGDLRVSDGATSTTISGNEITGA